MPKHLLWWGGVFLSLGGVVFCMGTTARLAGQFNNVHYTAVQSVGNHAALWMSLIPSLSRRSLRSVISSITCLI